MSIMLQAFYWDCPAKEKQEYNWWNFVAGRIPELAKSGFEAIWLPPISKAAETRSMGYDPYDYFDLGDLDQKGGKKTWFGNRAELVALIKSAHDNRMACYADMVISHNSGGDEEETNPLDRKKRWTKFHAKSGRFPRDWNCFHPSRYEVTLEGELFAGFPHLCHRNPLVYTSMLEYAQFIIEELGFDGFRFDFVKGYGAWIVSAIAKYRYVKDGREFSPFVVGEYWEDGESIEEWLTKVNRFSDNQVAAFDFPLRYQLKDVCDTFHYDLRKLTRGGAIVSDRPRKAVTFVDIEYGMMASYAEGLNILRHANAGKQKQTVDAETTPLRNPEYYPYDLNIADIAEVWRRGSVIASWLLDLAAISLLDSPDLAKFAGRVSDSGEGRWTIKAAIDESVPAPVLSAALHERFSSRGEDDFAEKLLSALRFQFGGHQEKSADSKAGA
jgi:hypothetical protein